MTQWLACQEAMHICTAYINWCCPEDAEEEDSQQDEEVIEVPGTGVRVEANDVEGGADSDSYLDDESTTSDDSEEADPRPTVIEHSVYDFAKTSPLPGLTTNVLACYFGAKNFLPALHSYLQSLGDIGFKKPSQLD
ncbi:hypothetical protein FRB93_012124 [Tulasnella sp. JGI-2019a]|nr:hypothetical protein FRB93_012124 [Tulasnella sp. JGI-2019a]